MNQRQNGADVLLIPLHFHGHVTPFLYVASRIIQRGLTCTVLLDERARWSVDSYIKKYPVDDIQGFHIEWMPFHDAEGAPAFANGERACQPFLEKLLHARAPVVKRPTCMIVDQFAAWTSRWSTKLMIHRYIFVCSPATFAYWSYNSAALIQKYRLLDRIHEDPIQDLPGAPKLQVSDSPDKAFSSPQIYTTNGDAYQDAAGILINTFYELEAPVIDHFRSQLKARLEHHGLTTGHKEPQVLPIGPVALEVGADVHPDGSEMDSA